MNDYFHGHLTWVANCFNGVLIWGVGMFSGVPTIQVIGICVGVGGCLIGLSREIREWHKIMKDKR